MKLARYMRCTKCDQQITCERDAFTTGLGQPECQRCGLCDILTPEEWYAIFQIQSGVNIIAVRKQCSTLRAFPPANDKHVSIVEFSSPSGSKLCIVREW